MTKRRRPWLKRILIGGLVCAILGVLTVAVAYKMTDVPNPNEEFLTETTEVYYADGKKQLGSFATQERESIPLKDMPASIQDAAVAAEDRTFWTNEGIDPKGILRAFVNNVRGGDTQGASTITQQYVKVLYLTQDQTLTRKAREALLSLKIQGSMEKEEILEGYLNTIYFGRGAYGVQAAAETYFGVPAKKLNLKQSAALASIINNPSKFDPAGGEENRDWLQDRYTYVLDGMLSMDTITSEEHARAVSGLPKFPEQKKDSKYGGQRGHMLTLVRQELLALGIDGVDEATIDGGGLRVTTTLRPRAMQGIREGVESVRPLDGPQLHAAAASVEVGTGALLGFYGGHDYLKSQINWARSGGMAGSTMKVFTNAAAITDGFSLRDTFDGNSPIDINGSEFENQGDTDYGSAVTMLSATENSINTAYVDMVSQMSDGPQKVIDMARAMGLPGNQPGSFGIPRSSNSLEPNIGVTLGTAVVSPINMANSYATVANRGERAPVHVIDKVVDRDGRVLYQFKSDSKRAMSRDIAADVSYSLEQVVQSGSGTAALELGRPAAGKTGTATNDKGEVSSSWFVGYTPQVSTAVMYVRGDGNDQLDGDWLPASSDGNAGYFGGNYPAKTWTEIMDVIMEGRPVKDFPPPVFVDGDEDSDSGEYDPYTPPPTSSYTPPPTSEAPPPSSEAPPPPPPSSEAPPPPPPSPEEPTDTCGPLGCGDPPGPSDPGGGPSDNSPAAREQNPGNPG